MQVFFFGDTIDKQYDIKGVTLTFSLPLMASCHSLTIMHHHYSLLRRLFFSHHEKKKTDAGFAFRWMFHEWILIQWEETFCFVLLPALKKESAKSAADDADDALNGDSVSSAFPRDWRSNAEKDAKTEKVSFSLSLYTENSKVPLTAQNSFLISLKDGLKIH